MQTAPQVTIPADATWTQATGRPLRRSGNGYLEPRQVTIGERFGDRVAVTGGLQDGEIASSPGHVPDRFLRAS